MPEKACIAYVFFINIVAFILFGLDKHKARCGRRRIPERVLLGFAALGGSIGAWLGMKVFHHKTLHKRFSVGIPLMFLIHLLLVFYLLRTY